MKKECQMILGYGKYTDQNTKEEMLRIVIAVDSKKENYKGIMTATAFLNYDSELENDLNRYLENINNYKTYYTTTDDITTGRTRINKIIIENI